MSGVLGQRFGAEKLTHRPRGDLGEIGLDLALGVAPGKVVVRLGEAGLGEPIHHLRSRERLGEEHDIRLRAPHFRDHPFPERKGLGVRIVDAKDADALRDPEFEHALQLGPERLPVRRLEPERIDVLVFLGRILGVLNRAVGSLQEPLGVLAHVGVIGCALERDVERQLDAPLARLREQSPEVLESPELGDEWTCAHLPRRRWPRDCRDRLATDFGLLFGPLRSVTPIGWMGGRYSTSKPIAEISGSSASTSAKVPCLPGVRPADRGNSSYHVE